RSNQLTGSGSFSSTRSDNPDLFGFSDAIRSSSTSIPLTWVHRFTSRISSNVRYQCSRTAIQTLPYFGNKIDVSGNAGITGNDRDQQNWGPPALSFAGGSAPLYTC